MGLQVMHEGSIRKKTIRRAQRRSSGKTLILALAEASLSLNTITLTLAFVKNSTKHISSFASAFMLRGSLALCAALSLSQCASGPTPNQATDCVVSVKEQKLAYYQNGKVSQTYPISTSQFGVNDKPGKYGTPPGLMEVVAKIGHGVRPGTVFHSRQPTGEVIKPGTPGRDPIVSRIMWLRGMEAQNQNAYGRCIYIHGTADEADIGKPVSWGCIRMKSRDVMDLFNRLNIGSRVLVVQEALPSAVVMVAPAAQPPPTAQPPLMLSPQGSPAPPLLATALSNSSRSAPVADSKRTNTSQSNEPRVQLSSDGSTVVYTAPSNAASPGMVLRSRRSAASYQKEKDGGR